MKRRLRVPLAARVAVLFIIGNWGSSSRAAITVVVAPQDDTRILRRQVEEVVTADTVLAAIANAPIGAKWRNWIGAASATRCIEYKGAGYDEGPDAYWMFECSKVTSAVKEEMWAYVVDGEDVSIERVRFSVGWGAVDDRMAKRLCGLLENGGWKRDEDDGCTRGSAELGRCYADSNGAHLSVSARDSELVCELRSAALIKWTKYDARGRPGTDVRAILSRELEERLGAWEPELGRALGSPNIRDERVIALALSKGVNDGELADMIRLSAYVWITGIGSVMTTADAESLGELKKWGLEAVPEYAVEGKDEVEVCVRSPVLQTVANHEGASVWGDWAFVLLLQAGISGTCKCTEYDPERMPWHEIVVSRGEEFLARHPSSSVWPYVALICAEAHETGWSLGMGSPDSPAFNAFEFRAEAPGHRERAICLYSEALKRGAGEGDLDLRERMVRLRWDIDTNFHRFWCAPE